MDCQYHKCAFWGTFTLRFVKRGLEIFVKRHDANKGKKQASRLDERTLMQSALRSRLFCGIFTCRREGAGLWVAGGRGRVLPTRRTPTHEAGVMDPGDCGRLRDAGESPRLGQYGSLQLPLQGPGWTAHRGIQITAHENVHESPPSTGRFKQTNQFHCSRSSCLKTDCYLVGYKRAIQYQHIHPMHTWTHTGAHNQPNEKLESSCANQ